MERPWRHGLARHYRVQLWSQVVATVAQAAILATLAGYLVATMWLRHTAHADRLDVVIVPCPSEDSCTVDYYDGAWYIGPPGSLPGSVPPSQR